MENDLMHTFLMNSSWKIGQAKKKRFTAPRTDPVKGVAGIVEVNFQ